MDKGSIIQIIDEKHPWYPCVLVVDEVKSWGIVAYISMPLEKGNVGEAFNRIEEGKYEYCGEASIVHV